jgi:hypothetical protein
MTVGTGDQSFTTQTGKSWVVGQPVVIARTSAPTTTQMSGAIKSYNSGTGATVVTVATGYALGSGTFTDWTISLTAPTPTAAPWGMQLLATATASSSATVDFATGIDSTYDEYELHFQNLIPATNAVNVHLRVSTNGGSTYVASGSPYESCYSQINTSGTSSPFGGSGSNQIQLTGATSNSASAGGASGVIRIISPASTAVHKQFLFSINNRPSTSTLEVISGTGTYDATTAINAVRLFCSSGNIASGSFKLYGIRKS